MTITYKKGEARITPYRIENTTIDGDGKIRIKITTVHN